MAKLRETGRNSLGSGTALKSLNVILRVMDRHAHFQGKGRKKQI